MAWTSTQVTQEGTAAVHLERTPTPQAPAHITRDPGVALPPVSAIP